MIYVYIFLMLVITNFSFTCFIVCIINYKKIEYLQLYYHIIKIANMEHIKLYSTSQVQMYIFLNAIQNFIISLLHLFIVYIN